MREAEIYNSRAKIIISDWEHCSLFLLTLKYDNFLRSFHGTGTWAKYRIRHKAGEILLTEYRKQSVNHDIH